MPNVVWCSKCKKVIWAVDAGFSHSDIRGFLNEACIPCPECGQVRHFGGWLSKDTTLDELRDHLATEDHPIYDWWSALKCVAAFNLKDSKWAISPDNRWFLRPGDDDHQYQETMRGVFEAIRARYSMGAKYEYGTPY